MGIVLTPASPNLEERKYIAFKRTDISTRSHSLIDASACGFDLMNCKLPIPQFVDPNDTADKYKNDQHWFLIEKQSSQNAIITVTNNTIDDYITITNNNFGRLYDFGTYPTRPLVAGVRIDWHLVQAELGFGCYTVKVELFNEDTLAETPVNLCFELMPFSCEKAHGTIRFETVQTGYIHNGFDYRGIYHDGEAPIRSALGWKQQIRSYGRMYMDVPDEQADFIQMSDRIETQIQQKITGKYKIELHKLHSAFGVHLTNDNFLATEIYVSDYNLNGYELYRDKYLRKVNTDSVSVQKLNSSVNYVFTFKEMDEGTVKRVYG